MESERCHRDAAWRGIEPDDLGHDPGAGEGEGGVESDVRQRESTGRCGVEIGDGDPSVLQDDTPDDHGRRWRGSGLRRVRRSGEPPAVGSVYETGVDSTEPQRPDLEATRQQGRQGVGGGEIIDHEPGAVRQGDAYVGGTRTCEQRAPQAADRHARAEGVGERSGETASELRLDPWRPERDGDQKRGQRRQKRQRGETQDDRSQAPHLEGVSHRQVHLP